MPASRADLFSDKLLSLSDKRSLGRFLSACVEAQQGYGRLKVRQAVTEVVHHSQEVMAGCLVLMQMTGAMMLLGAGDGQHTGLTYTFLNMWAALMMMLYLNNFK